MGNKESVANQNNSNRISSGHQIIQVQENSPAFDARLIPIFDYIISAQEILFESDGPRFGELLGENLEKPVILQVYNSLTETVRSASIIPSTQWGGVGVAGMAIRWASFRNAAELVWRVLEVFPDSPAAECGFEALNDYIVGSHDIIFANSEDFFVLINNNINTEIPLYVYNAVTEKVRTVVVKPQTWKGEGVLGCDIGYGLLHKIPLPKTLQEIKENAEKVDTKTDEPLSNKSQNQTLLETKEQTKEETTQNTNTISDLFSLLNISPDSQSLQNKENDVSPRMEMLQQMQSDNDDHAADVITNEL